MTTDHDNCACVSCIRRAMQNLESMGKIIVHKWPDEKSPNYRISVAKGIEVVYLPGGIEIFGNLAEK